MERLGSRDYTPRQEARNLKEVLYLAEQSAAGDLKVVPGDRWALHYPTTPAERAEKLKGLMEGRYKASEVVADLKPDVLIYDLKEIEAKGLDQVSARIRDHSSLVQHYDYPRFAQFVADMGGHDISFHQIEEFYNGIVQARVQNKLLDSYGMTGRRQLETALSMEAKRLQEQMGIQTGTQRVLSALKLDWLCNEKGLVGTIERDKVVAGLSGEERELYKKLSSHYSAYISSGDEAAYQRMVSEVQGGLPKPEQTVEPSESMQELEKELEQFKDQVGPPGSPEDPAIPPDDQDEYHTPPMNPGETKEMVKNRPIFEIEPPLSGYYIGARCSYYDIGTKTWSKQKRIVSYSAAVEGASRHSISGVIEGGIKSLPIPNTYVLDTASLKFTGGQPNIFRDQNGCFYITATGRTSFSIDFLKETSPFESLPVPEDLAQLYSGSLSSETEVIFSKLVGDSLHKAQQIRQYVLAQHFYPGGGDLQSAQALQYKLRHESSSDNYIQNLDASEYLECYSANTLFIALLRKAGIPSRLVRGDRVQGSKNGKSVIDATTGHAWSEIWDGTTWVRIDATPVPKPEDKKDKGEDGEGQNGSAEEAEDGGDDSEQQNGQQGQPQQGESQERKDGQDPSQTPEADDSEVQQGESKLEQAQQEMQKMSKEMDEMKNKIDKAEKFEELKELKEELEKKDLLDEMKESLEDKLEAKEEQMKEEMKDLLDKMEEDGFLDEERRKELEERLKEGELSKLDKLKQEIERENRLYQEYDRIREEVYPLVDEWYRYFAERLPRKEDVSLDEDSLTRQGSFDRRSISRPRNLIFGTIKNPRVISSSIEPRFMASIMLDVSGSMKDNQKLSNSMKLLVFYSELFSRITEEFGYVRFSINIFSDSPREIKTFEQDYDSAQRYEFSDGSNSTVKVRLMKAVNASGGTNMLDAIKTAADGLRREVAEYPDYASAFYFIGDGEDTNGNSANIKKFLADEDAVKGFGQHMRSAIMLGNESQRQILANLFGDEATTVASDFDGLVEQSMVKFEDDIEEYLKNKVI